MKLRDIFRSKGKSISLKWKLFGFFSAFAGAILLMMWVFQIWLLDDFYLSITKRNLNEAGTSLSQCSAKELQTQADSIALSHDICVLIFDNSGRKLASSEPSGGCIVHKLGNGNLNQLYSAAISAGGHTLTPVELTRLPGGGGSFSGPSADANESGELPFSTNEPRPTLPNDRIDKKYSLSRLVYSSVVNTESGVRFILLDCPLTPVGLVSNTLMVQMAFISLIAAMTALLAAFLLSGMMSKPLKKLSDSAVSLANGDYNADFEGGGYREIDRLSQSLSYAANELSKVDRMQKELIANVSHDLRTPLTMISGYAEVMRDIPGENTPENVQVIIDETSRLTALVNDLIEISKLQSGRRTLNFEVFSLTNVLKTTAERFEKLNECKGYTISCHTEGELSVRGDRSAITQVLYNLIGNGVTYAGEDKTVYVSLRRENDRAIVEITDTGSGIPSDELEHIWERYYRSEENHERGVGGSGIGLSIVKELLDAHGAEYGVTSTVGKGSTFYFILPITK
ncbi:MAG: HAMP domain-containing histidine kinase [Clostridia bacterium]|nr:HAMP domain-containing histidine kinase [Clostridia bacterium]